MAPCSFQIRKAGLPMQVTRPSVSFVIPAYNGSTVIGEAIRSILDANFEENDELIVVDDDSTDSTLQVVTRLQQSCSAIRILRHRENKGTSAASMNTGVEAAANSLIFCLDQDNLLVKGSILGLVNHLLASGAGAAAFGEIHFFETNPEAITHRWQFQPRITLAGALSGHFWPGGSGNYLFTRESWERAGRYHEPYLENRSLDCWTFAIRQLGTGTHFVTLPGSFYFHRYGHTSMYVREWKKGNRSLAALIALIPFLDQIEVEDIEYLFGKDGRDTWFERLAERPIRTRTTLPGEDGALRTLRVAVRRRLRREVASWLQKASERIRG